MLSFAEELILIALDDEKGKTISMPTMSLEYGLAGALLMELALNNKIDTDLTHLMLIDSTPTGDVLLDKILGIIGKSDAQKDAKYWIKEIVANIENIKEILIEKLVEKRVLKIEEHKILWFFHTRRYPVINNKEEKEVKKRIREIILNDLIPDPKDVVIVCLIDACDLVGEVFSKEERGIALERINQISKMDLIGQAVSKAVNEFQRMITSAIASVSITNGSGSF